MPELIDFFFQPRIAFRRISRTTTGTRGIALFSIFLAASVLFLPVPVEVAHWITDLPPGWRWLQSPSAWNLLVIGLQLYSVLQTAICVHLAAKFLGGRARWGRWLVSVVVITSTLGILELAAYHHKWLFILISFWKVFLIIAATSAVYRFSALRAIVACSISWLVNAVVVFMVLVGGFIFAIANPRSLAQFLTPPVIHPISTPARYDWTLKGLDGRVISAEEFRGKTVVLNFWATWCGPCLAEMPSLDALYAQVKDEGVLVVAVSDEAKEKVQLMASARDYKMPIYVLQGKKPAEYATRKIPATFILTPQGTIAVKHTGAARWDAADIVTFVRGLNITGSGVRRSLHEATVLHNNAAQAYKAGHYAEAEKLFIAAIRSGEQQFGTLNEQVAASYNGLGSVYFSSGRLDKAIERHKQALAILSRLPNPRPDQAAATLRNLAMVYRAQGDTDQAAIAEQRAAVFVSTQAVTPADSLAP